MQMERRRTSSTGIQGLLQSDQVRRRDHDGRALYAAADIVAVLNDGDGSAEAWQQVREREPCLAKLVQVVDFASPDESSEPMDALDVQGVLRLVQALRTPRAEKLKAWLAATAAEWLDETEN